MPAFFAIIQQTVRTSVRQKVFLAELLLVLLIVTAIPATCTGDGTPIGLIQLVIAYTLGLLVAVCSAATLWIACLAMSREIEGYQMHLVTSAPTPRWLVFCGKWAGVFLLQSIICLLGAAGAFGMLQWRVAHERFQPEEMERLQAELFVARQSYTPALPDFDAMVETEYRQRLDKGELPAGHDPKEVKYTIRHQVKARSTEVAAGMTKFWEISRIAPPPPEASAVFLRYRHYAGEVAQSKQKELTGQWFFRSPVGKPVGLAQKVMSGVYQEIPLPPSVIARDGTFQFAYRNLAEANGSVVFQLNDGPCLLVPAGGFAANYCRAIFLVLLQLAFLAALGCTVSAIFSSPVAIFMATSYIVLGIIVQAAVTPPGRAGDGAYTYKNRLEQATHLLAVGVQKAVVSVNDFNASQDLTQGHKISLWRLGESFGLLIGLRTLPMALLGIWIFTRRELGLVIRE